MIFHVNKNSRDENTLEVCSCFWFSDISETSFRSCTKSWNWVKGCSFEHHFQQSYRAIVTFSNTQELKRILVCEASSLWKDFVSQQKQTGKERWLTKKLFFGLAVTSCLKLYAHNKGKFFLDCFSMTKSVKP